MAGIADDLPKWVSPVLASGAVGLRAGSEIAAGVGARRAGDAAASMADIGAGNAIAASQRVAQEQERKAKLVASRAQAVAAASGAGASDPTVQNIIADISKEGAYRSQLALYEGNERGRAINAQGAAARYEGRDAQRAGAIRSMGTLLGFASTLRRKYGADYGTIDPTQAGEGFPY